MSQWPLLILPGIARAPADCANRQVNALIPHPATLNISTVELVDRYRKPFSSRWRCSAASRPDPGGGGSHETGAMREVKAPSPPGLHRRVFLAGSIEMGKAEQWQERIVAALSEAGDGDGDLVILNPRRDDWDDSWEQRADDPRFSEQVSWELDMLDAADVVVMYFAPGTKSPVSLLEFGLCARSGKLKVCCPEGFWRRGNVEMVCRRLRIPLFETLDDLIADLT
jgi:nucleoside 2-deoxyribosyltransferase-like protein